MKKIVALLAMATLFTTVMAQEVSIGGWVSTEGRMTTDGGKDAAGNDIEDDAAKAKYQWGATEFSYTINAVGENFGFTGTLDGWNPAGSTALASPGHTNVRVYSQFHEMFTLSAGYNMKHLNFAPGSMIEGGKIFDDQLGMGMGKYNYANDEWSSVNGISGLQYTKPVTGLVAEVKVADLEAAVVFRAMADTVLQENATKNNMVFNVKYDAGIAVAYAGLALRGLVPGSDFSVESTDANEYSNNGLWLAASVNALEGLTSDIKYETNLAEDAELQVNVISLNLGYDLGVVAIGTESTITLTDEDAYLAVPGVGFEQTMAWTFGMRVTPANVPVVGVSVDAEFRGNNVEDSVVASAFGLNVNKVIGNVNNQLSLVYDGDLNNTLMEDPTTQTMVNYKITMWF